MILTGTKYWIPICDGDWRGLALYKKHYSNRNHNRHSPCFVGQGEKLVLMTVSGDAIFAWRKSMIKNDDGQEGVNCTIFQNNTLHKSSDMIKEASEMAWNKWGKERLYTYVDPRAVASCVPGYCFLAARWKFVKNPDGGLYLSKRGLLLLE